MTKSKGIQFTDLRYDNVSFHLYRDEIADIFHLDYKKPNGQIEACQINTESAEQIYKYLQKQYKKTTSTSRRKNLSKAREEYAFRFY